MTMHVEVTSTKTNVQPRFDLGLFRYIHRFRREEGGSILILSLFLLIMMLMIAGMAVDLMRSETQRTRLQSTLDRAVLAGASLEQSLDSEAVVRDYFEKAGLSDYLSSVSVVEENNSKTVTATANATVDTYFLNMLGIEELVSPAVGQAEESLSNIEISLVLDISGSMGWWSNAGGDSKINLMEDAAKEFVYRMQCNPGDTTGTAPCTVEANTVSISLVPYAEQVLVGEDLLQRFNVTNEHTDSSCADFDQSDFSIPNISLSDTLTRAATVDPRTNYRSSNSNSKSAYSSRRTCRTDSYRKIVPLSNSYTNLQTLIGQLQASGYTSIDMGMKWGTALLSPTFRPAVSAMTISGLPWITNEFADRPYDYNERSMQKIIVLMTDGENTTQYVIKDGFRAGMSPFYKNTSDGRISAYDSDNNRYRYAYNDTWNPTPYGDGSTTSTSCYWNNGVKYCDTTTTPHPGSAVQLSYADFWQNYNLDFYEEEFGSFLADPVDVYGFSAKNIRLNAICAKAKAQGIEVFTIGFETSSASNAIMQSCATTHSHHFDVEGLELDDAFTSIAREIHKLRLTL